MARSVSTDAQVVIIARLPTERSLMRAVCARAGLSCEDASDPVSGISALVEYDPALVIISDDQLGVDMARLMALLEQHFPRCARATIALETKRGFKLDFGSAKNNKALDILLPSSLSDVDVAAAKIKAAVGE